MTPDTTAVLRVPALHSILGAVRFPRTDPNLLDATLERLSRHYQPFLGPDAGAVAQWVGGECPAAVVVMGRSLPPTLPTAVC